MKISAINGIFTSKLNPVNHHRINLSAVQNDAFIRTTSFKGSDNDDSFQAFKKWAEETDFLINAESIIEKKGKVLGCGFEGMTIGIPGNDKWVIKVIKRSNFSQQRTDKSEIFEIEDKLPDLNIGQMIAYVKMPVFEDSSRLFYILRRQKGNSY